MSRQVVARSKTGRLTISCEKRPNLRSSQMEYNLSCFLIGDEDVFKVQIASTEEVGNLANKIIATKERTLTNTDPSDLALYMVEIDGSLDKDRRIDELRERSQNLDSCSVLNDAEELLSAIFGGSSRWKYTIVQIPLAGESVVQCRSLRPC
jgi:hypothetical protein